jgi:hypothetical protein
MFTSIPADLVVFIPVVVELFPTKSEFSFILFIFRDHCILADPYPRKIPVQHLNFQTNYNRPASSHDLIFFYISSHDH